MITSNDMNTNVVIGVSGNIIAQFMACYGITTDGVIATLSIFILVVTFIRAVFKATLEYKKLKQFNTCKTCNTYKEIDDGK